MTITNKIVHKLLFSESCQHILLPGPVLLCTLSSKFKGLHTTITAVTYPPLSLSMTKPEGGRDQQPASLTSRTSALKRGTQSLLFSCLFFSLTWVSFHFQTFSQFLPSDKEKKKKHFQRVKKSHTWQVSPTASYIISFRHFQAQSLTISTVTFSSVFS